MENFKGDTVFIIASHAHDYEQVDSLHNLCSKIKNCGYEYIISSHIKIPDHILSTSRASIFDKRNKLVPVENRDLTQRGFFYIKTSNFLIESPFFMHGGNPCYTQAHLDNVLNCLINALRFGFKYAHFLTYDSAFEIDEIMDRENKLRSLDFDFVGFEMDSRIMGDTWSINLSKINIGELLVSGDLMEERVSQLVHDDSAYIQKYLLSGLRSHLTGFDHSDYRLGSQVSPRKAKKAEWALFYASGTNCFIQNISGHQIKVSIMTSRGTIEYDVFPETYIHFKVYDTNEFGPFVLKIDGNLLSSIDLTIESERKYWIETTKFQKI